MAVAELHQAQHHIHEARLIHVLAACEPGEGLLSRLGVHAVGERGALLWVAVLGAVGRRFARALVILPVEAVDDENLFGNMA